MFGKDKKGSILHKSQAYKIYVLIISIIIILATVICIGMSYFAGGGYTQGNRPVEAASSTKLNSTSKYFTYGSGGYGYCYAYLWYNSTYFSVGSSSASFSIANSDDYSCIYSVTFTLNLTPKSGYSWGNSSYDFLKCSGLDSSLSSALSEANSDIRDCTSGSMQTATRSGNTFTVTATSSWIYSTSYPISDMSYGVVGVYADFRASGSYLYNAYSQLKLDYGSSYYTYHVKHNGTLTSVYTPSKTGHTFGGYYTGQNGTGTQYFNSSGSPVLSTWPYATGITLYAKWTIGTYTITLNKQSGAGGTDTVNITYQQAFPNISPPTRSGWDFQGYYSSTNGSGTKYYNADGTGIGISSIGSNTTFYAFWAYNVTVNLNGGQGYKNIVEGNRSDWSKSGNNLSISFSASTNKYTLTPSSTSDPYSNTGTTAYLTSGVTYMAGAKLKDTNGNPTSSMQVFYQIGYSYNEPMSMRFYQDTTNSFLISSTGKYNFRFDNDSGATLVVEDFWVADSTPISGSYVVGLNANTAFTIPEPFREGHDFNGWTISGSGASISGNTVKIGSVGATLTANWIAREYYVSFDKNFTIEGTIASANFGTMETASITLNKETTLPANGYMRNGYRFLGWSTSPTATTPTYQDKATVLNLTTFQQTINLYAVWQKESYTTTLNLTSGKLSSATGWQMIDASTYSLTSQYGSTTTLPTPTRSGYTFAGWVPTFTLGGETYYQVFYHDVQGGAQLFANEEEAESTNSQYKFSILKDMDMLQHGSTPYTYWLAYEHANGYNNWSQSTNPLSTTVSEVQPAPGYTTISTSWTDQYWGGLATQIGGQCLLSGSVGHANWYYPIAPSISYTAGMPSSTSVIVNYPNGKTQSECTSFGLALYQKAVDVNKSVSMPLSQLAGGDTFYFRNYDTTLTPLWIPNAYTVSFDSNGAQDIASKSVIFNTSYGNLTTPSKDGYIFLGWETELYNQDMTVDRFNYYMNGSTGAYVSHNEYSTFKASVVPGATYTIINSGGSTGPGYSIYDASGTQLAYKNYANTITVSFTTPLNASYIIFSVVTLTTSGRYDADTFSLYGAVDANSNMGIPKDHSLTALWKAKSFTLKFHGNGNTGGVMLDQEVIYGLGVKITNAFEKRNHAFLGWATVENPALAEYVNGFNFDTFDISNYEIGDTINFYAVWFVLPAQVIGIAVSATYGGTAFIVGDNYDSLGDDDEVLVRANVCITGYKFDGWYFANDLNNRLSAYESEKFKKSLIYGEQLLAVFKPIDNSFVNTETNN